MNRYQAISNALHAVSFQEQHALEQLSLVKNTGNNRLITFWQQRADEAEQTYRELFEMLGECHEPKASPDDSTERAGNDGGHHPTQPGTGHEPGRPAQGGDGHDPDGQEPAGRRGGAACPAEVATGDVPGDEVPESPGTLATSEGIDAAGRAGCLHNLGGVSYD